MVVLKDDFRTISGFDLKHPNFIDGGSKEFATLFEKIGMGTRSC
ncbi:MAG TPA: hypothetical protein VJ919_11605 [Tangfeifania sp.]|nr:hypothetical protein [Tangfeifania sp.]